MHTVAPINNYIKCARKHVNVA